MIKIAFYLTLLFCPSLFAKTIKIAVIDSGITPSSNIKQCPGLSEDFTGYGLNDDVGHGSAISNFIDMYAGKSDYCQVILKVFDIKDLKKFPDESQGFINAQKWSIKAFQKALDLKVDIINLSAGGAGQIEEEKVLVIKLLNAGIIFVNAAGNNGINLDENCIFFPACYDDRIYTIGNLTLNKTPHPTSNYGEKKVKYWIIGTDVYMNNAFWTGTSFSAAIFSGVAVKTLDKVINK